MEENLKYCLSLRKGGINSNQIRLLLTEKELTDAELEYLLKKSDLIHIEQLIAIKNEKAELVKPRLFFKTIILFVSLFFLQTILFNNVRVNIVLLVLFWGVLRSTWVLTNGTARFIFVSRFNRLRSK